MTQPSLKEGYITNEGPEFYNFTCRRSSKMSSDTVWRMELSC